MKMIDDVIIIGIDSGSGMKSVIEGARSILAGDSDIVVCGGTENMSAAPYALPAARWGARMGNNKMVDTMVNDGLWDVYNNYHMGTTAENINDIWGITRKEQDEFAAASQQKTEAAQAAGKFDDEIVPVMLQNGVDVRTLQEVLGHDHLNTTQIYTHVDNDDLRTAARANPLAKVRKTAKEKKKDES